MLSTDADFFCELLKIASCGDRATAARLRVLIDAITNKAARRRSFYGRFCGTVDCKTGYRGPQNDWANSLHVPHDVKGSAIACACVLMPDVDERGVAEELSSALVNSMGASYRPEMTVFVDDLPRTRNLKVMRRVLRAVFENRHPGDLSALANPETVERLREKLGAV